MWMRLLCLCLLGTSLFAAETGSAAWNPKAAADYLDGRMTWWSTWKNAARDHDTFCVSCHTVAPYAVGRSALRAALGERETSPAERKMIANVTTRVRIWKETAPIYPDTRGAGKAAESRGTESIFYALILSLYDAASGKLGADAKLALDQMWAEQLTSGEHRGAWAWLEFQNAPWEGSSQYYGTTLAAIAVGSAPEGYRSRPEVQEGMKLLRDYLLRERDAQMPIDRVMLLWASSAAPGLLTKDQQQALIQEALGKQQEDGGFTLSTFAAGWKRHDNTPLETKSDGYATGLVVYALRQAGVPRDDARLKRAASWLASHQEADGHWQAWSLNKNRDLASDVGKFMSDAATAYAVLALKETR
jgi:squalene-hopene/tetraprenyl-beta-curcumene cyclase